VVNPTLLKRARPSEPLLWQARDKQARAGAASSSADIPLVQASDDEDAGLPAQTRTSPTKTTDNKQQHSSTRSTRCTMLINQSNS